MVLWLLALRYLDVCYNQLTNLPGALGHLSNLEQLYARHNRIACLPVLKQCSHLKVYEFTVLQIKT